MICKECKKAKPFAIGSVYCLLYGIIIDEKHEGNLEGCDREYEYPRGGNGEGTEVQGDGGGAAESVPGVVQGPWQRESVFGLGEEWPE